MARARIDDAAKTRLKAAVKAVEAVTAAELVIAVRPRAGRYVHVDLAVGAATAYLALLYTLFAPQVFGLIWIALIVPLSFALGALVSAGLPPVRLWLAGAANVEANLRAATRAAFVELGIARTRGRTGILVYVAMAEGRAAVLADDGVRSAVPKDAWRDAAARVEATLDGARVKGERVAALCAALEGLAPLLSEHLPRSEDDVDELEDVA